MPLGFVKVGKIGEVVIRLLTPPGRLSLLLAVCALGGCGDAAIDAAKKSVEAVLSDPQSVQYKEVRKYSEDVVCGEFNAKNKLGGYVGFKPFVYNGLNDKAISLPPAAQEVDAFCKAGEKKRSSWFKNKYEKTSAQIAEIEKKKISEGCTASATELMAQAKSLRSGPQDISSLVRLQTCISLETQIETLRPIAAQEKVRFMISEP